MVPGTAFAGLDDGLVAYYPFTDGSTQEATGNGNDAIPYGAVPAEDRFGDDNSAYRFDGMNDYMEVGYHPSLDILQAISVSVWIKFDIDPHSVLQGRLNIVEKGAAWLLVYFAREYQTYFEPHQIAFDLYEWQGVNTTGICWEPNIWYHIVGTYDGSQAKIYVNGTLNNTNSFTKVLRTNNVNFFVAANMFRNFFFPGVIDEIRLYNRALSEAEIKELAKVNHPPVANCENISVSAEPEMCTAQASIDAGSFDPDSDPVTLTQNPAGPYPVGTTEVTLTVTDDNGLYDECTATVTVVDDQHPSVQCNAPATISPPDVPISFTATAPDNCNAANVEITEYDCFKYNDNGMRIDKTDACMVEISSDTVTILDSGGVGTNITWTVNAIDGSSNSTTNTCGVVVVKPN